MVIILHFWWFGGDVRKYWCMALEWSDQGSKCLAKMGNFSWNGLMCAGSS